jgi:hypothetical protein
MDRGEGAETRNSDGLAASYTSGENHFRNLLLK